MLLEQYSMCAVKGVDEAQSCYVPYGSIFPSNNKVIVNKKRNI